MRVRLSGDPEAVAQLRTLLERAARGAVCVEGSADYVLSLRVSPSTFATLDGIHSSFEAELAQQLTDQRAVPAGLSKLLIKIAAKPSPCEGEVHFPADQRDVVVRACYRALMAHAGRAPKPARWWHLF